MIIAMLPLQTRTPEYLHASSDFGCMCFFLLRILPRKGLDNEEDKRPLMPKECEMQVPQKDAATNALDAGPTSALPMQPNLSGR